MTPCSDLSFLFSNSLSLAVTKIQLISFFSFFFSKTIDFEADAKQKLHDTNYLWPLDKIKQCQQLAMAVSMVSVRLWCIIVLQLVVAVATLSGPHRGIQGKKGIHSVDRGVQNITYLLDAPVFGENIPRHTDVSLLVN